MTKTNPRLSIITICYNQPDIEQTCQSVINQSWRDFEWIVIDGGSTDGTLEILKKYKDKITKLVSEKDNGRYNAMNKGIRLCSGDFISFLNGGDSYFDNDALKNVFEKNEYNECVLYGNVLIMQSENTLSENNNIRKLPEKLPKDFFVYDCICHQSTFISKSLFDKYGLYDETYQIISDREKWLLFTKNNVEFRYIDLTISNFKNDGISSLEKHQKLYKKERRKILSNYYPKSHRFKTKLKKILTLLKYCILN